MATDDDDDPSLRSLRSMWLSMPDEEPPARGLDALMAAARVKAEEMAKPSLWQRFTTMFARPPVLALATVMVLVGGAVFIGSRGDKMQAPPHQAEVAISQPDQAVAPQGQAAPAPAADPAAAAPALEAAAPMTPPAEPVERAKAERAPAKRPAPARSRVDAKTATKSPPKVAKAKNDREDEPAIGGAATGAAAAPVDVGQDSGDFASTTSTAAPERAEERPSTIVQLHKRALAAAARGDCESARTTIKRIQTEDVAYYKSKVASDSALRRCLTED